MYKWLKECLACGGANLFRTLDLGYTPLANRILDEPEDNNEPTFPLEVMTCSDCWHSQLSVSVEPSILFEKYDYVSGTTQTLKDHFKELAASVRAKFREEEMIHHLDIASNDGTLCEIFDDRYTYTSGVDPARNLQLTSFKKGVNTLVDYWTEELGRELANSYDVITALNVFAHNQYPLGFLRGCYHALTPDGILIIEFPYSPRYMLDNINEGHVYHEHQSYFTVNSFVELALNAALYVSEIEERPIHGGSIRLWLKKATEAEIVDTPTVKKYIEQEKALGLYNLETYSRFENTLKKNWEDLARVLLSYKKQRYVIIGYGASAKSTTLLNGPFKNYLRKPPKEVIDFVVDDNPRKVNKFLPGSHIYITETKDLKTPLLWKKKVAFLNLVYNFKDEIVENIKRLRPENKDDILIEFVPKVQVSNIHENS